MTTEHTTINKANKLLAKFIALANGVALAEGCTLETTTAQGRTVLTLKQAALDGAPRVLLHVEATVARRPEKAARAKPEQPSLFERPAPTRAPAQQEAPLAEAAPVDDQPAAPELPEHLGDLVLVATPGRWTVVVDLGREPFERFDFDDEPAARMALVTARDRDVNARRGAVFSPDLAPVAWFRFDDQQCLEEFPERPMQPAAEPFAEAPGPRDDGIDEGNDDEHNDESPEAPPAAPSLAEQHPSATMFRVSTPCPERVRDAQAWMRERGMVLFVDFHERYSPAERRHGTLLVHWHGEGTGPHREAVTIVPREILPFVERRAASVGDCEPLVPLTVAPCDATFDLVMREGAMIVTPDGAEARAFFIAERVLAGTDGDHDDVHEFERDALVPCFDGTGRWKGTPVAPKKSRAKPRPEATAAPASKPSKKSSAAKPSKKSSAAKPSKKSSAAKPSKKARRS